jgi:hypothetical protein
MCQGREAQQQTSNKTHVAANHRSSVLGVWLDATPAAERAGRLQRWNGIELV